MEMNNILIYVIYIAMLLFAVSVHESAHGWMAERFGDPTARMQGRITLNPIAHIDIFGSIIFPLILALAHAPIFGWAKPVIVNPYNLRNYRRASIFISAAGPVSNLITASIGIGIFLILKRINIGLLMSTTGMEVMGVIGLILYNLIIINIYLAIFNLIPVPPLDGSHILENSLHGEALNAYLRLKPYGIIILILIVYTRIFSIIANPILTFVDFILLRG